MEQTMKIDDPKIMGYTSLLQYVYIVHEREFVKSGNPTFKIGKTGNVDSYKRICAYPKNSILLALMPTKNCHIVEKELIILFAKKYKQMIEYGVEYFQGNIHSMVKDMYMFINYHDTMETYKKPINKESEKIIKKRRKTPVIVDSDDETYSDIEDAGKKVCTKCGKCKPLSYYNKNKHSKDGLRTVCKDCQSEYNKNRYQSKTTQITITTKDHVKVIDVQQEDEIDKWEILPEPETMTDHISSESDDE
jgi:hypothetical protein